VLVTATLARPSLAFAPDKPKSLKVEKVGPRFVELDWRRVNQSDYYRVYRDGNVVAEPGRSSYRDEGLEPETTYEYRVSAVDDDGDEGPLSDPVQVTTEALPGPDAPTELEATAIGPQRIDLSWSAADSEVGVDFYRVFRDGTEVATSDSTAFADVGLEPDTEYEYAVSAIDQSGRESDLSKPASATTLAEPGPPPPLNLTATPVGPKQIDLDWDPPEPEPGSRPIDGYRVYRDGQPLGFVASTAFGDTDLSPDTEYGYAVSSVDDRGVEGERSQEVFTRTDPPADVIPPAAPTGLRLAGD
jgi:fibronectin type 3 domain-containing protein